MKNQKLQTSDLLNHHGILIILAQLIILLAWGGFLETSIVISGIFALTMLLISKKKIALSVPQLIFFVFSVWYLICSVSNGFIFESVARGLIPLSSFVFWVYISLNRNQKEKIKDIVVELSVWVALFSVIYSVTKSIDSKTVLRLSFPFDYSNACGIYFAVCFFMAKYSKSSFLNKVGFIFLPALVMTQSIGAVGVFVIAYLYVLIKEKKFIPVIVFAILGVAVGVLGYSRILQAFGTFSERLLHIYDGFLCILDHPLTGIGAGQWEFAHKYYQTGFYNATTIHSSITEIGVNSGIPGLCLFLLSLFFAVKNMIKKESSLIPFLMIVAHACLEFSLSFMAINIITVLLIDEDDSKFTISFNSIHKYIISALTIALYAYVLIGLLSSFVFQNKIKEQESPTAVINMYNESHFNKMSIKTAQCVAAHLYSEKSEDYVLLKNYKYLPVEIVLYNSMSKGGEKYLLDAFRKQPYNTMLKIYILKRYDDEHTASEIKLIENKAISNLSSLGRFLYEIKGEEK